MRRILRSLVRGAGNAGGAALISALRSAARRRRQARAVHLNYYEQSLCSQNGEDGILKELLFRIGALSRFFVEVGVGSGEECNTALLARSYGWSGVMIEENDLRYERLTERYDGMPVRTVHQKITRANVAAIFRDSEVPNEFDVLSIDIDGNDYWIWEALSGYRPRIVIIEYNAAIRPPRQWIMPYDSPDASLANMFFGASLQSYAILGGRLGYALLGTDNRGVNAFFIRRDLLTSAMLPEVSPIDAYHPARYGFFGLACELPPKDPAMH